MVQLFILLIIILIGYIVLKLFPISKMKTIDIVLSAIFIMITLIAKRFLTIMIPLFGLESLKIGLEYIPLMVAGYFLSPSYAYFVGLSSDLLGLILTPTGFPFFGFTLTMILVSLIPSLIKTNMINKKQSIETKVQMILSLLAIGAMIYICQLNHITISNTLYTITIQQKIFLILICLLVILFFFFIIHFMKMKVKEEELNDFSLWILSVISVEIFCTLFLSPLWLKIMYGIPFFVSFCIRVMKECFVIPLEILLGYTIVKGLKRILIKKI